MLDEWRHGRNSPRASLMAQFRFKEHYGYGADMYTMRDLFDYFNISPAVMQLMKRSHVSECENSASRPRARLAARRRGHPD